MLKVIMKNKIESKKFLTKDMLLFIIIMYVNIKQRRSIMENNNGINENGSYSNGVSDEKALTTADQNYPEVKNPENQDDKDRYYEIFDHNKQYTRAWSVASLTVALASVVFCFLGWVGVVLSVVAISLSVLSRAKLKYFDNMAIAGLIIGIFGAVFGVTTIVMTLVIGSGIFDLLFL